MKATQRLDKILAHTGLGTRSEIKQLVKCGAVTVNGSVAKDSGMQVNPQRDKLAVNGESILYREHVYLMMNKPPDVVSATEDTRERTVVDLLDEAYRHYAVFPVGRLDKDTEGLLLLTNDGALAHRLLSPRKHVPKTYYARVLGRVDAADGEAFKRGVELDDGYTTLPADLEVLSQGNGEGGGSGVGGAINNVGGGGHSEVLLTIVEGKFHQVKRMFIAVGKRVIYLKRMSMGPLKLDESLRLGEYRELSAVELAELML
jgi:16S rRNA pseudouridine516 synthase